MNQDLMNKTDRPISRRKFVQYAGAAGLAGGLETLLPAYARTQPLGRAPQALQPRMVDGAAVYDLEIAKTPIAVAGRRATATTINGTVPGPLLHLYEGQETILRVTNHLEEDTSIHWHGLLVPPQMDGVPGVSFPGILPGQTFEYHFPLHQYGTYWYHSHSGLQEQLGHYGPLIIHPAEGYPYQYDREYTVVLSDWTFENPYTVLAKLKKQGDYYNFQKRTVFDFFEDVAEQGLMSAIQDRLMWGEMRMNPTDIMDVTGATYTYLMNGLAPETNWTGLFRPGEKVLLHIINAAADSYFDVRIPGLPMTVVQASGQYVQPVETDEFRIAIAETYDVIVEPTEDQAYTLFAESMDRSGYARGTLAPREGMSAPVPELRPRPILTMADMGMPHGSMAGDMEGMDMGAMEGMDHGGMPGMEMPAADTAMSGMQGHEGHDMAGMEMEGMNAPAPGLLQGTDAAKYAVAGIVRTEGLRPPGTLPNALLHESDTHGPGNAAAPMMVGTRLHEPGIGLDDAPWRVLVYTDLRALEPRSNFRAPDRELELHLTGNMERFMWGLNGKAFNESDLIPFNYGERLRLTLVNDTMMNHPMHLHGMWMELENGQEEYIPRVHTVNVKPAERLSLLITVDAPGMWAFHCHILYHMEVGMFRVVEVSEPGSPGSYPLPRPENMDLEGHGHED
ncbi:MAG TPA: copper resistance system multicopper oxidase [Longimicrobiaceae bacterium]|nr:copper resistance system multicopper oxidase [Longimicrobiaceae bacterium]